MPIVGEVRPDEVEVGELRARQPARHVADERHAVRAEVEERTTRAARRRPARARPGPPARRTAAPRITASATSPTSSVVQWMSPSARIHVASSRHALSPSADVPVSFGSSPIVTSIAAPARKPVTTAFERNCAIQPIRNSASSRNSDAGDERDRRDELRRVLAAEPGREHRAARDRRERRARAGRDLPRRAEERVDDRARRRGVQAVLERDPGDARVAEVLRHDQRRDGDPRGQVAAQPPPVVAGQPLDHRQQASEAPGGPVLVRCPRSPILSRAAVQGLLPSTLARHAFSARRGSGPRRSFLVVLPGAAASRSFAAAACALDRAR